MNIRKPIVAGRFYEGSAKTLLRDIEKYIVEVKEKEDCFGVVVPHAGYMYSGYVAGTVYSKIALNNVKTFVILGPNHTGIGSSYSVYSSGVWQTPLGDCPIDEELANKILRNSKYLESDTKAHIGEHSIEVQLPFIQYFKKEFKFVPICLGTDDIKILIEIGCSISSAIKETGGKIVIIASSDMTHYEPHNVAYEKDKKAYESIIKLDEQLLFDRIREFDISMCGYAPVISTIVASKKLGAKKGELVKYMTSGEVSKDKSAVVGYAGLVLK